MAVSFAAWNPRQRGFDQNKQILPIFSHFFSAFQPMAKLN
jgi:hypothetical protein